MESPSSDGFRAASPKANRAGGERGFTLIEVLLSMVILLALLGAVAVSFSSVREGAELDEGAARFETLLRLAQAHAANTGRRVEISFQEKPADLIPSMLATVRVGWEADPFSEPGIYRPIREPGWNLDLVNELVGVAASGPLSEAVDPELNVEESTGEELDLMLPITFLPDGSSDSARVILASRQETDQRRVMIRVTGITGEVRREMMEPFQDEAGGEDEVVGREEEVDGTGP